MGFFERVKVVVRAIGNIDQATAPEGLQDDIGQLLEVGQRIISKLWGGAKNLASLEEPPEDSAL